MKEQEGKKERAARRLEKTRRDLAARLGPRVLSRVMTQAQTEALREANRAILRVSLPTFPCYLK